MKQIPYVYIVALVSALFVTNVSADSESSEAQAANKKLPTTPAELLVFLTGTSWHLQSGKGEYFGEGNLLFLEKGVAEHVYNDGAVHKKHWGVTNDMRVIWGGKYVQLCRFSLDFKTFVGSRNDTTGRRIIHSASSGSKSITKE